MPQELSPKKRPKSFLGWSEISTLRLRAGLRKITRKFTPENKCSRKSGKGI
jgi:hypothetical protein